MFRIARSEVVFPGQLSAPAREQLIDALYAVQREVFDGVDRASFGDYVVGSKAARTSIFIHKNQEGAVVGYYALHLFERELAGEPVAIVRGEAGTLRAYRGGNATARFALQRGLRALLSNPRRRFFYLGALVHPSAYSLILKYFSEVYPSAGTQVPDAILRLMDDMAGEFGLARVDPQNPLVRKVGWRTRDTDAERASWQRSDRPAVRFFLQVNPGYGEGHGLLTLVPLSMKALAAMSYRFAAYKLARFWR